MTCSNSGMTSPDAVMVFSIFPITAFAVLNLEGFKEVRQIQRGEQEPMSLEEFFNELDN